MEKKEISQEVENKLKEIWGKVGFIIHLSQMIEYNLANILAFDELLSKLEQKDSIYHFSEFNECANKWYDKLNKRSLGFVVNKAKEKEYFTEEFQKELKHMLSERNYVAHKLFRDDLCAKHLENDPEYYFERLENLIEEMYIINDGLVNVFNQQKQEYKIIDGLMKTEVAS